MITFFTLIFMLTVNKALIPHSMQPDTGILYHGSSKSAPVPNFQIMSYQPDTTTTADSLRFYPSRGDSTAVDSTKGTP